jgi:RNA polymerase sigma factor (sigma-70 family)
MNTAMPDPRRPGGRPEQAEPSDAELWERAVNDDRDSFGSLFDRHADRIYQFCVRRTGDRSAAEDLTSTTFLHAWRRRAEARFAGESALPWLYGVAANLARRHLRGAGRRRAALAVLADPSDEADPSDAVAHRMDESARLRTVLAVVRTLPLHDQELIALCVWQGLSYEETVVALRVPVGTVRSRLSRTRARLRRALRELGPAAGDEQHGE